MINIKRDEKKVKIEVETGIDGHEVWLYWNCSNELFARLLTRQLQKKFTDTVQAIRQEEYNRGYKDGRAKRGKNTWFTCFFKTGTY